MTTLNSNWYDTGDYTGSYKLKPASLSAYGSHAQQINSQGLSIGPCQNCKGFKFQVYQDPASYSYVITCGNCGTKTYYPLTAGVMGPTIVSSEETSPVSNWTNASLSKADKKFEDYYVNAPELELKYDKKGWTAIKSEKPPSLEYVWSKVAHYFYKWGQPVLAGGSVRDHVWDKEPKDFDLFILNHPGAPKDHEEAKNNYILGAQQTLYVDGWEVQVMYSPCKTWAELLKTFDWNCNCFAFLGDEPLVKRKSLWSKQQVESQGLKLVREIPKGDHLRTYERGVRLSEKLGLCIDDLDLVKLLKLMEGGHSWAKAPKSKFKFPEQYFPKPQVKSEPVWQSTVVQDYLLEMQKLKAKKLEEDQQKFKEEAKGFYNSTTTTTADQGAYITVNPTQLHQLQYQVGVEMKKAEMKKQLEEQAYQYLKSHPLNLK